MRQTFSLFQLGIALLVSSYVVPCFSQNLRSKVHGLLVSENGEKTKITDQVVKVDLKEGSYLFYSDGNVPLVLLSNSKKESTITLDPPSLEDWPSEKSAELLAKNTTKILEGVLGVQGLISSNKINEAEREIIALSKEFPEIHYLKFIQASIYALKGDKTKARDLLESALLHYPSHEQGLQLYKDLGGKLPISRSISSR